MGKYNQINTGGWDLYDLAKQTRDMPVYGLLTMVTTLEGEMTELAVKSIKLSGEEKEEVEKEFNLLNNKRFYLLERIADTLRGK